LNIYVLHGSVATQLKCDETFNNYFTYLLTLLLTRPVRLIFAIVSACWPPFSALLASFWPAASIFGPSGLNSIQVTQQHYGRSSMRCNADDASPWWRRLYDITANYCAQLCCGI